MNAICIDNTNYPASLQVGKIYKVVDDKTKGYLRVIDESEEDYLYDSKRFKFVPNEQYENIHVFSSI